MPLDFSFFQDSKRRPQSNSFLDSLQYPSIDRSLRSNPKLSTQVSDQPIQSLASLSKSAPMLTSTPIPTPRSSMPMSIPSIEEPQPEQDSTNFLGSLLAQGVASLGAGIQGGDVGQVGRSFEAGRQKAEQDRKAKALVDPKSEESKRRRMVFEKALGSSIPEEYSATDLNDPVVLQSIRDKKMQAMAPKGGTGIGVRGGVGQAKPEKERKLSQDERALLNNSALAYKALFDMEDAIKRDVSKTSYFGDNDYTYAANRFVEGIGRMQSGGAIGPDEVENFKKLIPGRFDSPELSKKKISDMKAELESRLKSINYDPNEVLKSRSFTELDISPSEQDQAIKWANENKNSKDEKTRIKAERILKGQ
jgi:hypothetical protein